MEWTPCQGDDGAAQRCCPADIRPPRRPPEPSGRRTSWNNVASRARRVRGAVPTTGGGSAFGNRYWPSSSKPCRYSGRYALSMRCRIVLMSPSSGRHRFADAPGRKLRVLEQAIPVGAVGGAVQVQRVDHLAGELDAAQVAGADHAVVADRQHLGVELLRAAIARHL